MQGRPSPADLSVENFDYLLPSEKIAVTPMESRDQSRLLVYKDTTIIDSTYSQITDFIKPGSLVIFNDSKVIQARLQFKTSTGAAIELFCLDPADAQLGINHYLLQKQEVRWRCLVGNLK